MSNLILEKESTWRSWGTNELLFLKDTDSIQMIQKKRLSVIYVFYKICNALARAEIKVHV